MTAFHSSRVGITRLVNGRRLTKCVSPSQPCGSRDVPLLYAVKEFLTIWQVRIEWCVTAKVMELPFARIAQGIERLPPEQKAVGSIPTAGTRNPDFIICGQ